MANEPTPTNEDDAFSPIAKNLQTYSLIAPGPYAAKLDGESDSYLNFEDFKKKTFDQSLLKSNVATRASANFDKSDAKYPSSIYLSSENDAPGVDLSNDHQFRRLLPDVLEEPGEPEEPDKSKSLQGKPVRLLQPTVYGSPEMQPKHISPPSSTRIAGAQYGNHVSCNVHIAELEDNVGPSPTASALDCMKTGIEDEPSPMAYEWLEEYYIHDSLLDPDDAATDQDGTSTVGDPGEMTESEHGEEQPKEKHGELDLSWQELRATFGKGHKGEAKPQRRELEKQHNGLAKPQLEEVKRLSEKGLRHLSPFGGKRKEMSKEWWQLTAEEKEELAKKNVLQLERLRKLQPEIRKPSFKDSQHLMLPTTF